MSLASLRAAVVFLALLSVFATPLVGAEMPANLRPLTILSPTENTTVRLDEPTTLAVSAPATMRPGAQPGPVYAWDLVRISDGRSFPLTPPACAGTGACSCRSILVRFGSVPGVGEGQYWLSVRELVPAGGDTAAPRRQALRIRLAQDAVALTGVGPGVVVAGEENVVLHGAGFAPTAEVTLLGSFTDGGCPSCPRPVPDLLRRGGTRCRATVSPGGRTIDFSVPISLSPGPYQVEVRQGDTALGGPVLRVVPRAIERPAGNDPHRVAWPLVSGQTIQGTFVAAADPTHTFWDYHLYYFYATAGSRLTAFLRRVDTSKSWLHPAELDPELAVATPGHYVPECLHGTDDRPNADFNASLTRAPLQWTGLYILVAATSKGVGRYELGFQIDRAAPPPKESRFVIGTGAFGWALKSAPAIVEFFLFDRNGASFSGAAVRMAPDAAVAAHVRMEDLTSRTSPWGFATATMIASADGTNPAFWFKADQDDAAYGPELYGRERKAFDVKSGYTPAFWTTFDSVADVDHATGELRLGAILIKRDPQSSPTGSRLRRR
jgi:hypothetical protein